MPHALPNTGAVVADKYLVETLIGRGGMGAVYVVLHRLTQKRLALKVLLPQFLDQPEIVERFLREAQSAGRIQHRHVVDVFDVGQDGDVLYIVMPLLSGKPLSTLLNEEQISLNRLLTISVRAMEGVAAAHAQGVVHRDLKPDNIYVCQGISGQLDDPKILDFGISRQAGAIDARLTQSGVMLGTPHYMAFEQIAGQRDLDERVDVYAMGAILYEALAGAPPFDAESVGGLAVRMMSGVAVSIDERCPGLPLGLGDVIMRALEREREQRFQTMNAFIAALTPFLQPEAANERGTAAPREGVGGHEPTLLALTPAPNAPQRLSVQSGVRSQDSQPIPQRTLALSEHDDDTRPIPETLPRPTAHGTRRPALWIVLALVALALALIAGLRTMSARTEATSEATPNAPAAAPPNTPAAAVAPNTPAPSATPEVGAQPAAAAPEAKPAAEPLLPDVHAELGTPSDAERTRRDKRSAAEARRDARRENAGDDRSDNLHDSSPTNPPLAAPSGEGPAAPEPAQRAPEPTPRAQEPAEPAPAPEPAPAAEPAREDPPAASP